MIQETAASGPEVQDLIDKVEPILAGSPRLTVVIACYAISLMVQRQNISQTELLDGIKGLSGWAATYLEGLRTEPLAPELLN